MSIVLDEHLGYVSDATRLEQFKAAISLVVKPGCRVADLGCGSGILGLLCLQAGASHVCFVDDGAMLDVARQTLVRAGLADRASFVRGRSQQLNLPERVDVVICDHVGCLGFDYGIQDLLEDARRRFLKPGGKLIPTCARLEFAAIESEACRQRSQGWCADTVPGEFRWLREYAVNTAHHVVLGRDNLLGGPAILGHMDFGADQAGFFSWAVDLDIERDGVLDGVGGWFDCELAEGVWMSNSPLAGKPIDRSQVFLPIGESVPVHAGDRIKASLMVRPAENLIAWVVEVPSAGRRFSQSTLHGMLLSPEDMLRANPERVPRRNGASLARELVLGYCDGRRTVREIEEVVLLRHPGLFPSAAEVSRFVAQVLHRNTD